MSVTVGVAALGAGCKNDESFAGRVGSGYDIDMGVFEVLRAWGTWLTVLHISSYLCTTVEGS